VLVIYTLYDHTSKIDSFHLRPFYMRNIGCIVNSHVNVRQMLHRLHLTYMRHLVKLLAKYSITPHLPYFNMVKAMQPIQPLQPYVACVKPPLVCLYKATYKLTNIRLYTQS